MGEDTQELTLRAKIEGFDQAAKDLNQQGGKWFGPYADSRRRRTRNGKTLLERAAARFD